MKNFIIIVLLLLVGFAVWQISTKDRNEEIEPEPEGLLEIDLSLGDENGEPLPQ
jgi:hypothetical protein